MTMRWIWLVPSQIWVVVDGWQFPQVDREMDCGGQHGSSTRAWCPTACARSPGTAYGQPGGPGDCRTEPPDIRQLKASEQQ